MDIKKFLIKIRYYKPPEIFLVKQFYSLFYLTFIVGGREVMWKHDLFHQNVYIIHSNSFYFGPMGIYTCNGNSCIIDFTSIISFVYIHDNYYYLLLLIYYYLLI